MCEGFVIVCGQGISEGPGLVSTGNLVAGPVHGVMDRLIREGESLQRERDEYRDKAIQAILERDEARRERDAYKATAERREREAEEWKAKWLKEAERHDALFGSLVELVEKGKSG